ncbi:hypothetical protein P43SY_000187 [Pythium insidiosum]|uniref:Uncharacterized protein n=1 Tax=Pythium insidiosum TaxID=114742 RepID=A0AAD5M812_PYTIN|nr:hypothetical protein P43SY_000187 [Pythium insidiosum]
MLSRYVELRDGMKMVSGVEDIIPRPAAHRQVLQLLAKLKDLDSVCEKLQGNICTMADARVLFDAAIARFPQTASQLKADARIVHSPVFENAVTKLCDETKRGTIAQHGHHLSSTQDEALPTLNFTMKRFICDKVKDKLKPSRILNAMIDAGFFSTDALDYKDAVKRYAHNFRTRGLGDNNDVDEMEKLLASRQRH